MASAAAAAARGALVKASAASTKKKNRIVANMREARYARGAGCAQKHVSAAKHKRGVVGWIEAEGEVSAGDAITIWLPPQRPYPHE